MDHNARDEPLRYYGSLGPFREFQREPRAPRFAIGIEDRVAFALHSVLPPLSVCHTEA